MTDDQLRAIRERNEQRRPLKEAATPGPWERVPYGGDWTDREECLDVSRFDDDKVGEHVAHRFRTTIFSGWLVKRSDVEFIAAARNDPVEDDVDALLAEVERLLDEVDDLTCKVARLKPPEYDC